MGYKPTCLIEKQYLPTVDRWALIVDLNGQVTDPLLMIIQNITGVDIAKSETKYCLNVLIGKAFSNDINEIIIAVKEKCLEFYTEETT